MLNQITDLNKRCEPNNINWTTEYDAAFKKQECMMTSLFLKNDVITLSCKKLKVPLCFAPAL